MSAEQRARMATVSMGGFCAMRFASDARIWPAFVAWAEQSIPGMEWNENDRQAMAADALILNKIGEALDA